MADHPQVRHAGGADFILALEGFHADFHGQLGDLIAQVGQRADEFGHRFIRAVLFHEGLDQRAKFLQLGAVVHQDLATQQIERLDRVGAFIDHVDARIAHVLFHAPFADEAMAAKDLHRFRGRDPGIVGNEGLDDRCEQRDQVGGVLAHFFIGMVQFAVDLQRHVRTEGTAAFGIRLGRQQHASHVGMDDDRIGLLVGGFDA